MPSYQPSSLNPCNQFLVNYLLKLRQQQSLSQRQNKSYRNMRPAMTDHQYHLYTRAIDSIKKYPLPIVCQEQLSLLVGIGDVLARKLTIVIKTWYIKFLKNDGVEPQKQESEVEVQIVKGKPGYSDKEKGEDSQKILNWMSECSSVKSNAGSIRGESDEQDFEQQNRDKMHPMSRPMSEHSKKQTSISTSSKQRAYKPKLGSVAGLILKAMRNLNATQNSVTKKDIDRYLLENNYDRLKQWKNAKDNLVKNGYVEVDPSMQGQAIFLTNKGMELAMENQGVQCSNITKKKMQSQINIFKQKYQRQQKQKQEASQSQSQSQPGYSNSCSSFTPYLLTQQNTNASKQCPLLLLIDTREMKDQSQRTYFQQTLHEKYKVDVITQALTLGDFLFCYNGHVLDFVIQRKKADDLAASIIDGRYKQQKWRLKNCGATNIIYLYQGHPSESSVLKQKQLMNALHKTRVCDNMKITKTSKPSQTVRYLSTIHSKFLQMIKQGHPIKLIGTIEEYNRRNTKNRYLTVENIFGLGLKCLPNVGKQTVTNLLRFFKSYYLLYQSLAKYQSNQERVQFLNGLLKGGRTQAGVTRIIVELLFDGKNQQNREQASQNSNSKTSNRNRIDIRSKQKQTVDKQIEQ